MTHKNIVSIFYFGAISSSYYFIDMELCDINLECYIERQRNEAIEKKAPYSAGISPSRMDQIWDIMQDITNGIAFIHSEKEIHRDLKPRNSMSNLTAFTAVTNEVQYYIPIRTLFGKLPTLVSLWKETLN